MLGGNLFPALSALDLVTVHISVVQDKEDTFLQDGLESNHRGQKERRVSGLMRE